ncbi:MAG: signal peptidase II [Defluviitaleaceae bacterium]|nr:signal peptidase II [Defluviitaleaceae bacterium]
MLYIITIAVLVGLDQIFKRLAYINLRPMGSIPITNFFSLTYLENRGAAFSILYGARWFFVAITIPILIGFYLYFRKLKNTKQHSYVKISIVILSAGAIGNFIDRLLFGFVIDYLHITAINFPVFNFADILIVTGAILFGIVTTFFVKE